MNIARFLQSLDLDRNGENGLSINDTIHIAAKGVRIDFTSPDFERQAQDFLNTLNLQQSSLVSVGEALLHLYISLDISPPDNDNDGIFDGLDIFPDDPSESSDRDNDGVGDNSDAFPDDPLENQDSCIRVVNNMIGFQQGRLSTWFAYDGTVTFSNIGYTAHFDPANTQTSRLALLKAVSLKQNSSYAFRVKVSDFTGTFSTANFDVRGLAAEDVIGTSKINFVGDGVYVMNFTYLGIDAQYTLWVGIGTDGLELLAAKDGSAHFSVSEVMYQELDTDNEISAEYVPAGLAWAFNYPNLSSYQQPEGLLNYARGEDCGIYYDKVWAITADSFGNQDYEFPQLLARNHDLGFAFYTDAVSGRTLETALTNITSLINLSYYPQNIAKPVGIIVEGGVNDLLGGKSAVALITVANSILSIATNNGLNVIFMTIPPYKNYFNWEAPQEQERLTYNQWLRDQGGNNGRVFIYDMAATVSSGGIAEDSDLSILASIYDGIDSDTYDGDGIHPNTAGHDQIIRGLIPLLEAR